MEMRKGKRRKEITEKAKGIRGKEGEKKEGRKMGE